MIRHIRFLGTPRDDIAEGEATEKRGSFMKPDKLTYGFSDEP